ncbi:potassium inward rectifier channel A [Amphimedon queenslandica]|uniref:Potassium inward rectifier channel A n=1 Tax=Amphimedon queenslandica TaxID=400682 RepID=B6VCZ8_AMPQE|nr:potassium inward rectifier channel A [Amphimedon queenslandica]ACJ11213.1 potassium inward rectifier channel A [Amphimedon queenslandica]|eukprot:NP_001266219.1 potassium inward rectifier channel A [Amphimedon queenslandica]
MEPAHKNVNYELVSNSNENIHRDDVPITFRGTREARRRERLVKRSNGRSLVHHHNIPPLSLLGYISDGFTTVLNARWIVIILLFAAMYVLSWLLFGFIWWGIDSAYVAVTNSSCVSNIDGFSASFLFSIETQVTIGYGYRFVADDCSFGILILVIQCLVGLVIDSFLLGLIFAKITRPRNRRKTILFSDTACINVNNKGEKRLQFRIGDVRSRSSLVEAHVRVQLYWNRKDGETDEYRLEQNDLEVGYDSGTDRIILLTPVVITHIIKETSPLYTVTNDSILNEDIEIVIILEAIVESTGLTAQALWSYTEREILFNYKFKPMIYRQSDAKGTWEVDFNRLSSIEPCSC